MAVQITQTVQELKRRFMRQRNITERFKLSYTKEQAFNILFASVLAEIELRHHEYKSNEVFESYIASSAEWLIDDSKIGLLLCGQCGNGKTTIASAIRMVINRMNLKDRNGEDITAKIVNAKEIVEIRKADDKNRKSEYRTISDYKVLVIDDLGIEPVSVLEYGNTINPVIDLFTQRYDKQLCTIVTTNLTPEEVRGKYGARIADRFNEMFKVIVFANKSFRGA